MHRGIGCSAAGGAACGDCAGGFFVCSPATTATVARCSFAVTGRVPELWNAETGEMFRACEWSRASRPPGRRNDSGVELGQRLYRGLYGREDAPE